MMEVLVDSDSFSRKRQFSSLENPYGTQNTKRTCSSQSFYEENLSNYQREKNILNSEPSIEQMDVADSTPPINDSTVQQKIVSNIFASSSYRRGNTVSCSRCQAGEPGHFNHNKMF